MINKNKRIKTIVSLDEDVYNEIEKISNNMVGTRNRSTVINKLLTDKLYEDKNDKNRLIDDLKIEVENLKRMETIIFTYVDYLRRLIECGFKEIYSFNHERMYEIDPRIKVELRKKMKDSYITFAETNDNFIKLIDEIDDEEPISEEIFYDEI